MKRLLLWGLLIGLGFQAHHQLHAKPPFSGTIFLTPDIITPADPTALRHIEDAGQAPRRMFDRRTNGWLNLKPFLFKASYSDGLFIEVQVNPEFYDQTTARALATKYASVIGRLPACLRAQVKTVWIHKGLCPFGGGNNNLLIHTDKAAEYEASGILEETLVHEAAHTSLDAAHAAAKGWIAAQNADGEFISTYARDYPKREDIAESFLPYLAVKYRHQRISQSLSNTIARTIPNRIAYFDSLHLDMNPIVPSKTAIPAVINYDAASGTISLTWASKPPASYAVDISTNLTAWQQLASDIKSQQISTTFSLTNFRPESQTFFTVRELPQTLPQTIKSAK